MALRPLDASAWRFFTVTALASVTILASTVIVTCLATTSLLDGRLYGLAVTTSVIDILSLCTLFAAVAVFLQRLSRPAVLAVCMLSAVFSSLATGLSLAALAATFHFATDAAYSIGNVSATRAFATAGLAMSTFGLFPQIAFLLIIWPRTGATAILPAPTVQDRVSPARPTKRRSVSVHLATIGPLGPSSPKIFRSASEPTSPAFSAFTSSPRSSPRHSAAQILRPMTSRTRLLIRTSLSSTRDSKSLHSAVEPAAEAMRQNDDFEHWDTSRVVDVYESPFGSRTRVAKLETIPGSRPVSPAHPLDGPFDDGAENVPLPDSPLPSPSACLSPASESGSLRNLPRAGTSRPSTSDQSHIHPLFRTESPVPPPLASPGTVILASPYAGQVVSPELALSPRLLHSAPGSRPGTPSLLVPVRSRTASVRSAQNTPTSPISPIDQLPARSMPAPSNARLPRPGD